MPLIQSQAQYDCVFDQLRALMERQREMRALDTGLSKDGSDVCLQDKLIELDNEIRDLADALADFDEVPSSYEFAVQMGSAAP